MRAPPADTASKEVKAKLKKAIVVHGIHTLLSNCLEQAGLSTPKRIAAAGISKSCACQVLRGERAPGWDILLRTALAPRLFLLCSVNPRATGVRDLRFCSSVSALTDLRDHTLSDLMPLLDCPGLPSWC